MKTEIVVARSVRAPLHAFVRARFERTIVLCDEAVAAQARSLARGLPNTLRVVAFPLGERRKTLSTVSRVLETLVDRGADRTTAIIGVGGGVAGDLFGFAASIFMRGVPYVHVATTLVSMVDASIGGKTGVDLPSGKNLAGTFRQPEAVFCWIDALKVLPDKHIREGLAEVVKHAIIDGTPLFEEVEALAPRPFARWPWERLVRRAQEVKVAIVDRDPVERGEREVLNLGHTFGHAIERASAYRTSHGAAVSVGLRGAGLLAMAAHGFPERDHSRVMRLLRSLRLPLHTRLEPKALASAMLADKKRRGGKLRFVLPRALGDVQYGVTAPPRTVLHVLHRLHQPPGADEFR